MMLSVADIGSFRSVIIPDSTGLEIGRSAREDSSRNRLAGLTSIHDTLGHGGEFAWFVSVIIRVEQGGFVRGAMVDSSVIVWLVTSHCLSRCLLLDH